jgi:hypothetical protein
MGERTDRRVEVVVYFAQFRLVVLHLQFTVQLAEVSDLLVRLDAKDQCQKINTQIVIYN